jgi:hypothetical protein
MDLDDSVPARALREGQAEAPSPAVPVARA